MKYFLISCFLLVAFISTPAQQNPLIIIRGEIKDIDTKRNLSSASIINPKYGITEILMPDGTFSIKAKQSDTLFVFLPGYQTIRFSVSDSVAQPEYKVTLYMQGMIVYGPTVVVKPKKGLEQIEKDRNALGEIPKEFQANKVSGFTSPLSALYELVSNEAQQKKKLREQVVEDNRRKVFYSLFDYYRDNRVMDVPEDHYDAFIDYCDLPLDFLKYSSDYQITKTLVDQYNKYSRLTGIVK